MSSHQPPIARRCDCQLSDGSVCSIPICRIVRKKARLMRRVLRKHGYPPDKQDAATELVIVQAERMGAEWAT